MTYKDVADHIGKPRAARAVANAVAQNPIPYIIPCHRVIRSTGAFGGYQSGTVRKKALHGWERGQVYGPSGALNQRASGAPD